ncbi:hypothetical protein C0J52_19934 [Blattella germanica]|nr:hypothetical protein C0J52_19934 [Blattella germanica]
MFCFRNVQNVEETARDILMNELISPKTAAFKSVQIDATNIFIKRCLDDILESSSKNKLLSVNRTLEPQNGVLRRLTPANTTELVPETTTVHQPNETEQPVGEAVPIIEGSVIITRVKENDRDEKNANNNTVTTQRENVYHKNISVTQDRYSVNVTSAMSIVESSLKPITEKPVDKINLFLNNTTNKNLDEQNSLLDSSPVISNTFKETVETNGKSNVMNDQSSTDNSQNKTVVQEVEEEKKPSITLHQTESTVHFKTNAYSINNQPQWGLKDTPSSTFGFRPPILQTDEPWHPIVPNYRTQTTKPVHSYEYDDNIGTGLAEVMVVPPSALENSNSEEFNKKYSSRLGQPAAEGSDKKNQVMSVGTIGDFGVNDTVSRVSLHILGTGSASNETSVLHTTSGNGIIVRKPPNTIPLSYISTQQPPRTIANPFTLPELPILHQFRDVDAILKSPTPTASESQTESYHADFKWIQNSTNQDLDAIPIITVKNISTYNYQSESIRNDYKQGTSTNNSIKEISKFSPNMGIGLALPADDDDDTLFKDTPSKPGIVLDSPSIGSHQNQDLWNEMKNEDNIDNLKKSNSRNPNPGLGSVSPIEESHWVELVNVTTSAVRPQKFKTHEEIPSRQPQRPNWGDQAYRSRPNYRIQEIESSTPRTQMAENTSPTPLITLIPVRSNSGVGRPLRPRPQLPSHRIQIGINSTSEYFPRSKPDIKDNNDMKILNIQSEHRSDSYKPVIHPFVRPDIPSSTLKTPSNVNKVHTSFSQLHRNTSGYIATFGSERTRPHLYITSAPQTTWKTSLLPLTTPTKRITTMISSPTTSSIKPIPITSTSKPKTTIVTSTTTSISTAKPNIATSTTKPKIATASTVKPIAATIMSTKIPKITKPTTSEMPTTKSNKNISTAKPETTVISTTKPRTTITVSSTSKHKTSTSTIKPKITATLVTRHSTSTPKTTVSPTKTTTVEILRKSNTTVLLMKEPDMTVTTLKSEVSTIKPKTSSFSALTVSSLVRMAQSPEKLTSEATTELSTKQTTSAVKNSSSIPTTSTTMSSNVELSAATNFVPPNISLPENLITNAIPSVPVTEQSTKISEIVVTPSKILTEPTRMTTTAQYVSPSSNRNSTLPLKTKNVVLTTIFPETRLAISNKMENIKNSSMELLGNSSLYTKGNYKFNQTTGTQNDTKVEENKQIIVEKEDKPHGQEDNRTVIDHTNPFQDSLANSSSKQFQKILLKDPLHVSSVSENQNKFSLKNQSVQILNNTTDNYQILITTQKATATTPNQEYRNSTVVTAESYNQRIKIDGDVVANNTTYLKENSSEANNRNISVDSGISSEKVHSKIEEMSITEASLASNINIEDKSISTHFKVMSPITRTSEHTTVPAIYPSVIKVKESQRQPKMKSYIGAPEFEQKGKDFLSLEDSIKDKGNHLKTDSLTSVINKSNKTIEVALTLTTQDPNNFNYSITLPSTVFKKLNESVKSTKESELVGHDKQEEIEEEIVTSEKIDSETYEDYHISTLAYEEDTEVPFTTKREIQSDELSTIDITTETINIPVTEIENISSLNESNFFNESFEVTKMSSGTNFTVTYLSIPNKELSDDEVLNILNLGNATANNSRNISIVTPEAMNELSKFANIHTNEPLTTIDVTENDVTTVNALRENVTEEEKLSTKTVLSFNNINHAGIPILTKIYNKVQQQSAEKSSNVDINHIANDTGCPENMSLKCGDGECISALSRCNQLVDCVDGTDEQGCTCADYLKSQFLTRKLCDGIVDCWDFSDENNCEWCTPGQFVCPNSQVCVDQHRLCDGSRDCPYGDDEKLCVTVAQNEAQAGDFPYNSEGYLMVRKQGRWGKLCLQNFEKVVESSQSVWEVSDLGRAVCKAMTYSDFDRVNRTTDSPSSSRADNSHYYELAYSSDVNSSIAQPRSSLSFQETQCTQKQVVHVSCRDLECGVRPQAINQWASSRHSRIVGGGNAAPGAWPWQAALYKEGEFQCGATLIADRWLVSAGHCFYHALDDYWVARLGALRRGSGFPSPYEQLRPVSHIILHPGYVDAGFLNDISLLRLSEPVQFSDFVRPVCLPPATNIRDGRLCTVVGWGQLFEVGRIFPDTLQEVQLPIISTVECRKRTLFLPLYRVTDNMFCAGFDRGGRDACLGDSGGPLMCQERDGHWSLYGVTSNGYGCARANRPGVYTKVANYVPWLQAAMAQQVSSLRDSKTQCKGHRCPLGECLPPTRVCNGFMECSDGSDEKDCW